MDGVVISSEAIYSMCSFREYTMFIKLDMAKAYDRVKCGFLQKVILASQEWVKWVFSCVTTPSFLVLLNGELSELFGASRGLHQVDPSLLICLSLWLRDLVDLSSLVLNEKKSIIGLIGGSLLLAR